LFFVRTIDSVDSIIHLFKMHQISTLITT